MKINRTDYKLQNFIIKANLIHNNKYDYSKSKYINNRTKLEIICPVHGSFWQEPCNHIKGHGCPYCTNNKNISSRVQYL